MSQAYACPRPHVVVHTHYAFTGGTPRQVLDALTRALALPAPATEVCVLRPSLPLTAGTAVGVAVRA